MNERRHQHSPHWPAAHDVTREYFNKKPQRSGVTWPACAFSLAGGRVEGNKVGTPALRVVITNVALSAEIST
ncbi:hypothetical protein Pmani_005207 [Petrolisthes manimaculis]|uniref:Uncharacterized protein n=1 Tax=Petrolisthes manimaculis TaxID=1843537 RepID=A0AAE1QDE7_9EUCA|nr:hypothetical protein Pmani_005207 [Petrolisthes manimaculis]